MFQEIQSPYPVHTRKDSTHIHKTMNKSISNFRRVTRRNDRGQECNTARRFLEGRNTIENDERAAGIDWVQDG